MRSAADTRGYVRRVNRPLVTSQRYGNIYDSGDVDISLVVNLFSQFAVDRRQISAHKCSTVAGVERSYRVTHNGATAFDCSSL